jgi:PPOX class probable F420-dependent enzyme
VRLPGQRPDASTLDRLGRETVLWLGTTGPDGAPHLVPVWFVWDGEAFLVFSKPNAVKVRHIAGEPRVALALGEPDDDFDVRLIEARAELVERPTREVLPASFLEKYATELAELGVGPGEYASTYSQVIRISPTRFKPWRGRTWLDGRRPGAPAPASATPAGLPMPRLAARGSLPAWA